MLCARGEFVTIRHVPAGAIVRPESSRAKLRGQVAAGQDSSQAHYTELLTTGKVETPGGGKYAHGFGDNTTNGVTCVGHNGGAPEMNGDLEICDNSYVLAVLANMDPPPAGRISDFIVNRLPAARP